MPRYWRWVFVALALACMLWLLLAQWNEIRHLEWELHPGLMLLASLALVALFFLDALGWHLILRALGADTDARSSIRTWLLSSLGRYLPGAVWGYVGRIAMSTEQGIPAATTVLALYLETLLLCGAAISAGLPAVALAMDFPLGGGTVVLLAVLLALLMHPRLLGLMRYLPGAIGRAFAAAALPSARRMFAVYLYYVLFWAAFGGAFLAFVAALQPIPEGAALPIAASMGLSFAAGLVAVFAPGGIGVRESALYLLLLPYMPAPACLLVAIGSRIWIMAGEAISVALVMAFFRTRR